MFPLVTSSKKLSDLCDMISQAQSYADYLYSALVYPNASSSCPSGSLPVTYPSLMSGSLACGSLPCPSSPSVQYKVQYQPSSHLLASPLWLKVPARATTIYSLRSHNVQGYTWSGSEDLSTLISLSLMVSPLL